MPKIDRRTWIVFGGYAAAFVVVAVVNLLGLPPLLRFVFAVIALAFGAVAVSEATERLAVRMSPAATGVVHSTLGNLPELFLAIFALQAGLTEVVAAALVGSVLGNALFVLGLALLALFAVSVPFSLRLREAGPGSISDVDERGQREPEPAGEPARESAHGHAPPLGQTLVLLGGSAASAAFVAEGVVDALE